MDKKGSWVQTIDDADIWYCEGGKKQIYVGLVKDGRRHYILSVVAETVEEAVELLSEDGDIITARSLRDILSSLSQRDAGPILQ